MAGQAGLGGPMQVAKRQRMIGMADVALRGVSLQATSRLDGTWLRKACQGMAQRGCHTKS